MFSCLSAMLAQTWLGPALSAQAGRPWWPRLCYGSISCHQGCKGKVRWLSTLQTSVQCHCGRGRFQVLARGKPQKFWGKMEFHLKFTLIVIFGFTVGSRWGWGMCWPLFFQSSGWFTSRVLAKGLSVPGGQLPGGRSHRSCCRGGAVCSSQYSDHGGYRF